MPPLNHNTEPRAPRTPRAAPGSPPSPRACLNARCNPPQPTSTVGAAEVSLARKGGELTARSAIPFAVRFPRSFRAAVLSPSPNRPRQAPCPSPDSHACLKARCNPPQPTSTVGAAEVSPARKGGEVTARSAIPFAVRFPRSFRVAVLAPSPDRPRQPRSRLRQVTNLPGRQAGHKSQVTNHVISNRHTSRLQSAVTSSKQTAGTHSNRQFLTYSARNFPPTNPAARNILAAFNRRPTRLETSATRRKQTLRTHLNRQLFAVFIPIGVATPSHFCDRLMRQFNLRGRRT